MSDREERPKITGAPWQGEEGVEEDNSGVTAGYVGPSTGGEEESLDELKSRLGEGAEEESSEELFEEEDESLFEEPIQEQRSYAEDLVESLRRDPKGTLESLARYYNIPLGETAKAPEPEPEIEIPKIQEGEEFYDYIGRLQKGLVEGQDERFRKIIREEFGGLAKSSREARDAQNAIEQTTNALLSFLDKTFPDWKQYEPEMQEIVRNTPNIYQFPRELYRQGKALAEKRGKIRAERTARTPVSTGERGTKPPKTAAKEARSVKEAFEQLKREGRV